MNRPSEEGVPLACYLVVIRRCNLVVAPVDVEHEEDFRDRGEEGLLFLSLFFRDGASVILLAIGARQLDVRLLQLPRLLFELILLLQHLRCLRHEAPADAVDHEQEEQQLTENSHRGHDPNIVLFREEIGVERILGEDHEREPVSKHLKPPSL